MEDKNISIDNVPKKLYHIVPINLFKKYTDSKGTYDPRNRDDFGKNANYVHTTPSIEQINEHLTYLKQIPEKDFYLLEIDIKKLKPKKITYFDVDGRIYHHLWCSLNKESYTKRIVRKNINGEIIL